VEHPALVRQERGQEPTDATVAVRERMDRLELDVSECDLDERRHTVVVEEEALEVRERRRDEMVGQRVRRQGGWLERAISARLSDIASGAVGSSADVRHWSLLLPAVDRSLDAHAAMCSRGDTMEPQRTHMNATP